MNADLKEDSLLQWTFGFFSRTTYVSVFLMIFEVLAIFFLFVFASLFIPPYNLIWWLSSSLLIGFMRCLFVFFELHQRSISRTDVFFILILISELLFTGSLAALLVFVSFFMPEHTWFLFLSITVLIMMTTLFFRAPYYPGILSHLIIFLLILCIALINEHILVARSIIFVAAYFFHMAILFYFWSSLIKGLITDDAMNEGVKERFQSLIRVLPCAFLWTKKNAVIEINEGFCRWQGESEDVIRNRTASSFWDPYLLSLISPGDNLIYRGGVSSLVAKNERYWYLFTSAISADGDDILEESRVWFLIDMSVEQMIKKEYDNQKSIYSTLIEHHTHMIFYLNKEGIFSYANLRGTKRLLDCESNNIIGQHLTDILHQKTDLGLLEEAHQYPGTFIKREVHVVRPNGEKIKKLLSILESSSTTGYKIIGFFSDVDGQEQSDEHVMFLAMHDELTGLPNRRLFQERLEQSWKRHQGNKKLLVVMSLDLNKFKEVNDHVGHGAGDHVLEVTGYRLRSCLRPADTAARIGGDEFMVLLEDVSDFSIIMNTADKIVQSIGEAIPGGPLHVLQVYASLGVVIYPIDLVDNLDGLLSIVDEAMYKAKKKFPSSIGGYCFYNHDDTSVIEQRVQEFLSIDS